MPGASVIGTSGAAASPGARRIVLLLRLPTLHAAIDMLRAAAVGGLDRVAQRRAGALGRGITHVASAVVAGDVRLADPLLVGAQIAVRELAIVVGHARDRLAAIHVAVPVDFARQRTALGGVDRALLRTLREHGARACTGARRQRAARAAARAAVAARVGVGIVVLVAVVAAGGQRRGEREGLERDGAQRAHAREVRLPGSSIPVLHRLLSPASDAARRRYAGATMRTIPTLLVLVLACAPRDAQPPAPPVDATNDTNCTDPRPGPTFACVQDCGPLPVVGAEDPPPGWRWLTAEEAANREKFGCPICLPEDTSIATPDGDRSIALLRVGDAIWTVDTKGDRVRGVVVHAGATPTSGVHTIVRAVLADGRIVSASPAHPDLHGRTMADLTPGAALSGSTITSVERVPYHGTHTHDVLPSGPTRAYWADGVLLRSSFAAGAD